MPPVKVEVPIEGAQEANKEKPAIAPCANKFFESQVPLTEAEISTNKESKIKPKKGTWWRGVVSFGIAMYLLSIWGEVYYNSYKIASWGAKVRTKFSPSPEELIYIVILAITSFILGVLTFKEERKGKLLALIGMIISAAVTLGSLSLGK